MPLDAATTREPIVGYRLTERIGTGGYGEVWKCEAPGGLVKAIKLVYGYHNEIRASRELKALNRIKQVRHPFLLSLERIEVVEGQLVIVTELADMCLKDRFDACLMEGQVGIARDELLVYLRDAADALDYMSEHHGLQHLDVKPENLLLVGGRVKVADFGLVKDLHEVTASVMGGMTPLYSPPEMFDGRASLQSDQYSLAVVFQEMLTGQLPFTGKTPAQLAAQHLQAAPRIGVLPAADQPIIARALSKRPDQRFRNCRELIDRLFDASRGAVSDSLRTTPTSKTDETSIASQATQVLEMSGRPDGPSRNVGDDSGSIRDTKPVARPVVLQASDLGLGIDAGPQVIRPKVKVSTTRRVMPPVELSAAAAQLRPTLIVGVGGVGTRIVRQFRKRLAERSLDLDAIPSIAALLIDTDADEVEASFADHAARLDRRQILATPLRTTQQYRAVSSRLLRWLSRRWLYNIPRCQKTQGIRPLGRLTFVDHFDAIQRRVQECLARITQSEAISQTAASLGVAMAESPRVVIISAISGGTGGGMSLDLGFLAQQLLAQHGWKDARVTGLLLYSTDRHAETKDLAAANAFAFLNELYQYQHAGGVGYPGDAACKLDPRAPGEGPFHDPYLLHLGEDLTEEDFGRQLDDVVEYLCRDVATTAGAVWQQCRLGVGPAANLAAIAPMNDLDVPLRSAGLCRVGGRHVVTADLTAKLCRQVGLRWLGVRATMPATTLPETIVAKQPSLQSDETPPTTTAGDAGGPNAAPPIVDNGQKLVSRRIAEILAREFRGDHAKLVRLAWEGFLTTYVADRFPALLDPSGTQLSPLVVSNLEKFAELLRALRRQLRVDTDELADTAPPSAADTDVLHALRHDITRAIEARLPELASRVEERFFREFFGDPTEVAAKTRNFGEFFARISAALNSLAQEVVHEAAGEVDVAGLIIAPPPTADAPSRLERLLTAATPQLLNLGGAYRQFVLLRGGDASQDTPVAMPLGRGDAPTVVWNREPEVAVCCEAEQLSLIHAASRIVADRPMAVQAAARLHTRIDVVWTPLPDADAEPAASDPALTVCK